MNVYQKILEVKKVVKGFEKDAKTSGKGAYKYTSGSSILSAVKTKMEDLGLLFIPTATEHRGWTTFKYKNSYGDEKTDFIVEGKICYEWVNVDEPTDRQPVSFEFYGQQNDISKAFGSALTYSERYLLLKSLGAPTDEDDPDSVNEEKNEVKQKNAKPFDGVESPKNERKISKWAQVHDLIKNVDIELASVKDWIIKSYGRDIPINDLTDEQFEKLMKALKKCIAEAQEDE